jgi:Outer membrane efflux protein
MADGFSGIHTADPLAERGIWSTKLEAAKDLLLRQVAASRVQDVAVFSFADTSAKIFHGARSDFSRAFAIIRGLEADGETNLAGGLIAVTEDSELERYEALSVLILSDGLSNVGDPVAAAERLISKYPFGRVDTILIDETEEGRRIAESVSINGSVRPAFSVAELGQALESARASSLRQELSGFALRRLGLQSELALLANVASPTLLIVTSAVELTAASLRNDIVPTLEGLDLIGRAASEASGVPYRGTITSISQDSPISISLSGFKEAVELALEWVIPWRRQNAERLAALKLRQQELENEKATIENRRLQVELATSKFELAERMLATIDQDHSMSDRRRQRLLQQFVHGIDQMSKTSIEFRAIGPSSGDDTKLTRQ